MFYTLILFRNGIILFVVVGDAFAVGLVVVLVIVRVIVLLVASKLVRVVLIGADSDCSC